MKSSKLAIIIPALNESESIAAVINCMSVYGTAIVVNDGSTDNTELLACEAGALVVSHEDNRGYDLAISSGLEKALEEGFDFAITVDADGQHEPAYIEMVLVELLDGADLVVGIRDKFQRISETLFACIAKLLWGIYDPLCGMKGYRLSKLKGVGSLCSYPSIGTEIVICGVRSGWNVRQVAVKIRARKGKSRFGAGFYANWLIFRAMQLGIVRAQSYKS